MVQLGITEFNFVKLYNYTKGYSRDGIIWSEIEKEKRKDKSE